MIHTCKIPVSFSSAMYFLTLAALYAVIPGTLVSVFLIYHKTMRKRSLKKYWDND